MLADGILILSHCGYSFVEDLVAAISQRQLQAYVLTSRPLPEQAGRLDALRALAADVDAGDTHALSTADVDRTLDALQARGVRVRACISVWEGYRALMAHANARLGVADLDPAHVESLRDKLHVRNTLHAAGLSSRTAYALTPHVLRDLQAAGGDYFVKPLRGIASYGAFRLTRDTTWATLEAIADETQADTVYASVFGDRARFIAEEYVSGTEFSFELLAVDGRPYVVAIHEKCELTEANGTVLEDSCTSPPVSIAAHQCAAGIAWLGSVFAHLALGWGCFHVEARFDGTRWDLIEINPRVGGSLISPSVKALTGDANLLDLWLGVLLDPDGAHGRLARLAYAADGHAPGSNATFFRVYFASPGRIEEIRLNPLPREPIVTQVLLKPGDEIDPASREVFLGQLLWSMSRAERDAELDTLLATSADAIAVHYGVAEPALGA
ncbi:ATP-grasp domain-containing protein [Burkholderia stagnalis]|uniref:ATP-grasp domain-containing protein n=1 Tax=Burkholderia stagnalis TaxID=1503054 RepID=UPI000A7CEC6D|nr:ATP-grasp domain-containing protein [Burkholderia stagnalis]